MTKKAYVIFGN